jgi:hypothetical protein
VLAFEREEHVARVRLDLEARHGMDYYAAFGPDVAELVRYNREPSFVASTVR